MSDFTDSAAPAQQPDASPTEPARSAGLISSASAPAAPQVSAAWADASTDDTASPQTAASPNESAPTAVVELSAVEARVLGALVEKSFLTPDAYPMTTNGMVTACNQKTNRDPVVDYSAVVVDAALLDMRQRGLVRRVHAAGARSTKHRQTLDEALNLTEQQLALLSVLLLRGPQTIGELRLRTERHDVGFDDLDAVESCLLSLASRSSALVMQLERQPGHKEARWQHLLSDDSEPLPAPASPAPASAAPVATSATSAALPDSVTDDLTDRVAQLETEVATLRRQLAALAGQLGESLE